MEYYKFGQLIIPSNLVFLNKQYCYGMIPVVKLLPGHVLVIPKRQAQSLQDLDPAEIFDLGLAVKFLTKWLEKYFDCTSCSVNVSTFTNESDCLNHCFIHIIPRKINDIKRNDDLYPLFNTYPNDFIRQFHNTLGLGNAFSEQMRDTLSQEAKKYKDYFEEKQNEEIQLK